MGRVAESLPLATSKGNEVSAGQAGCRHLATLGKGIAWAWPWPREDASRSHADGQAGGGCLGFVRLWDTAWASGTSLAAS